MRKFLSLVKLLFVQQYRIKPSDSKKKRIGTIVALCVLGLCFLPMIVSVIIATYALGKVAGPDAGICSLLILVCQGLVLIFGTLSIITTVFNANDADKLLYLPVKPITIFLAKFTVVYINEVITSVVVILIALLPFGIGANVAVGYYFMLVPAILLIPVLPLFVGCLVSIVPSALLARFKNNGVLKIILQTLFFVAIFALYFVIFNSISNMSGVEDDTTDITELIQRAIDGLREAGKKMQYVHPDFMLATAMTITTFGSWALAFLTTLAENFAMLGILALATWPFYRWILSSSLETGGAHRKKAKAEDLHVKNNGVVKGLIASDFKRVIRNGQVGFQAFAGLVIMPVLLGLFYLIFNRNLEEGETLLETLIRDPIYQLVAPLVIMAYMTMLGIGSNTLGLYPISRENKSLYVLKSLPISFGKILLAKVIFATVVMLVCDFLTCLLTVILFGVEWYYGIAMLVVMALLGFGGTCITTLLDLKSPKLGWTNFTQSLKNAKNSWLAMLMGVAVSTVISVVAVAFIIWFVATLQWFVIVLMWLLIAIVSAVFAVVCYKIMVSKAETYFAKIEP